MKECIFWDSEDGKFINWEEVSFTKDKGNDFVIVIKEIDHIYSSARLYDSFDYIGLNDTNNNKIYADCSIVKLGNDIGFIKYSPFLSANVFICLSSHKTEQPLMECSLFNINNMEIIDTIQENKLGLIKE